jgi:hypothetical protein
MKPIQWDKQEMFTAPNGQLCVRYAISDHDGVVIEHSMHDPTIQSMLPVDYWLPVYTAPVNNARADRIDGRLVVLCGFGKPDDPTGNLFLMRLASRPGFSATRLAGIIGLMLVSLAAFGIRPDQNMMDTIRKN